MAPEMRFRVVSLPATVRRRKNSSSSSSESLSPSTSTWVRTLMRSSCGIEPLLGVELGGVGEELDGRLGGVFSPSASRLELGVLLADHPVGPVEHVVAVVLGDAQEVGDHLQGELGGDVGDEVGLALLDDGVDDVVGRLVDLLLEGR